MDFGKLGCADQFDDFLTASELSERFLIALDGVADRLGKCLTLAFRAQTGCSDEDGIVGRICG